MAPFLHGKTVVCLTWLIQKPGNRAVSAQRFKKWFGSHSEWYYPGIEEDYCIPKMEQCFGGSCSGHFWLAFCVKYFLSKK